MKVILVQPKISFEDNYPCSWIPYSIFSIASTIASRKVQVILFDENREDSSEFFQMVKENASELLCIGFSIVTGGRQISNALRLASDARKINEQIPLVFGGPHVNVLPLETLAHDMVDIVLQGLGQNSFAHLLLALQGKALFEEVPGLYMKSKIGVLSGTTNNFSGHLLPPYNFDLIDISKYIQNDAKIATRTINYIASQGCVYGCRFCYETSYKRKYFKVAEGKIINDINYFTSKGVNGIKFYDADWFVDRNRSLRVMEHLRMNDINWAASIHPNDIVSTGYENYLDLIAKSGCRRLLMGMESGNDRVLKEIVDKRVTTKQLRELAKRISDCGIIGSYTFIVGFPGETEQEIFDTFAFISELWEMSVKPETRVHIYTPYPGTALYDEAVEKGFKPPKDLEAWSTFDYYKVQTPWVAESIEQQVVEFTKNISLQ